MPEGELIGFNSFVENSTRATDPSYSNYDINEFQVYGTVNDVLIYDGDVVSRPSTETGLGYGSVWAMEDGTQQYWIAGAQYKFVGIVDGNVANVTKTNLDGNQMPTSIEYTADGATDLLCQTIDYTAKSAAELAEGEINGLVKFNFKHLLSKVNFTVVNGSKGATGYSFVVKDINFDGATKATYDVVNAKWLDATATGKTLVGNNERSVLVDGVETKVKDIVVATGKDAELATEVLFLPGEYTISFTVDILYNGKLVTTTNYPVSPATYTFTLDANNAYNFKVNVAVGQLIEFTVEEQPEWNTDLNKNDKADDDITLQM